MSEINKNKKRDLTALALAVLIIVLLNFVGSFVFHRFDLTAEKRYTLSDATKNLLSEINDVVYVKVYLDGDFPAGFKRLRDETREMLDEFRAYSNDNIEYEFINPSVSDNKKQQNEIYKQLYDKGLEPTNLEVKEENGTTQQIIWPAALVTYKGRELPWQLLKTQMGQSAEGQLNNSIQALEYEFASVIRNLSKVIRPQIGFIEGHGELDTLATYDIAAALSEFYIVKRVEIKQQLKALEGYKAIVIAKPDTAFSEQDQFILDQYIMKGGKVLWVVDPINMPVDSLSRMGRVMAVPYTLGIDKMLYKYGVRVNENMVVDMQCSAIPINKALKGQQPRFELMPWIFSPLLNPTLDHPIAKNLDIIKTDFASTIDTIEQKGVKKTILLQSSKYSKTLVQPVRVDLNYLRFQLDEKQFNNPYQNVAVLLEGEFQSVFKNRIPPEIANDSAIGFKANGVKTAMIVISDGDIIRNDVQYQTRKPYPLGFDKYTQRTYGNRNFILNCINYLCDDSGLISVRARELTLRLLDKKKVKNEGTKWKVINTAVPLLLVIVYGLIYYYIRKRKYSS
ncbi:MAG: gliding motility-associated ABC transporter substrate-binding protein GldG [Bacteroidetes bacterium]|nr:gliding motility-associated ABC transporter substrate-binding protein GldG [Bacteroidota bacterium]